MIPQRPGMRAASDSGGVEREDWAPAPSGVERRLAGFLHTLDLDAGQEHLHADAFERLRRGALQAIVVHGVFAQSVLQATVQRLERHDPPFLKTSFPRAFHAWFYGRNVNLADGALAGYFQEAEQFNAQLDTLMPAGLGLEGRIAALLSTLDGGRAFARAPGPRAGECYMFTTLRAHLERGYIPAHYDNEMRLRPSYRHLASLVDEHIVSFVLALSRAESGGALEVFDMCCEPHDARLLSDDRVTVKPDTSRLRSASFRLPPGSLIVLDSGRYLHRVTPVGGARTRWTACSFMARSRSRETMYCWG